MSITEYTTGIHSVLEVPLLELAHPNNLPAFVSSSRSSHRRASLKR